VTLQPVQGAVLTSDKVVKTRLSIHNIRLHLTFSYSQSVI
jgi:hypothetical protein